MGYTHIRDMYTKNNLIFSYQEVSLKGKGCVTVKRIYAQNTIWSANACEGEGELGTELGQRRPLPTYQISCSPVQLACNSNCPLFCSTPPLRMAPDNDDQIRPVG